MCEQIITKQKHPSPCLPQELCPGQARPPCPRPAPGRARAQHRHGGQHLTPPGSQGASVLPAGSQRNKPSLPLLQHTENRGTACCWSSPSSSAGSPPLGPPGPHRRRAGGGGTTEPGRSGRGRASRLDLASAGYPASAPSAPDSGRYCSFCNWHRQPAIT